MIIEGKETAYTVLFHIKPIFSTLLRKFNFFDDIENNLLKTVRKIVVVFTGVLLLAAHVSYMLLLSLPRHYCLCGFQSLSSTSHVT